MHKRNYLVLVFIAMQQYICFLFTAQRIKLLQCIAHVMSYLCTTQWMKLLQCYALHILCVMSLMHYG